MRISYLLLTLLFFVTSTSANDSLKNIFDELNYELLVEWDQEDQVFYNASIEKFKQQLVDHNVSNDEIVEYVKDNIFSQKQLDEFNEIVETVELEKLSDHEIKRLVIQKISNSYVGGANFKSTEVNVVGVIVLTYMVAFIAYFGFIIGKDGNFSFSASGGDNYHHGHGHDHDHDHDYGGDYY